MKRNSEKNTSIHHSASVAEAFILDAATLPLRAPFAIYRGWTVNQDGVPQTIISGNKSPLNAGIRVAAAELLSASPLILAHFSKNGINPPAIFLAAAITLCTSVLSFDTGEDSPLPRTVRKLGLPPNVSLVELAAQCLARPFAAVVRAKSAKTPSGASG